MNTQGFEAGSVEASFMSRAAFASWGAATARFAGFTLLSLCVLTGTIGLDNKRHRLTL